MAFTPSGRDLWVGSGEDYTRLKDAIAASQDGDTIHVKAGTYLNDFATITNSIRIVGEGGTAHLKSTDSHIDNGKAILVINADVELENLEFSGAKVSADNGAGIRFEGGSLSIENSYFHHNQNGILAGASNGRLTVNNSEFAYNGNGDGQTHGLYVGKIDSLTVTNSYFHDTQSGHHIKSRADTTTITNSRLIDGSGGADYNIDLPNGNVGVIRNNVIEQSSDSANRAMVHYGGEASSYSGSLLVEGNEFISHGDKGVAVRNQTPIEARIEGNVLHNVDTIAYGVSKLSGNTVYDGLSHVGVDPAPAPEPEPAPLPEPSPEPTPGSGSDSSAVEIQVRVSGDDFNGDPKFSLYLDGHQLGATKSVTADHSDGAWQTFTFSGNVDSNGLDEVAVSFSNDAWGGSNAKDRNLYVDWIEVDGTRIQAEDATYDRSKGATLDGQQKMSWNGSLEFDTGHVELLGVASHPVDDGMSG